MPINIVSITATITDFDGNRAVVDVLKNGDGFAKFMASGIQKKLVQTSKRFLVRTKKDLINKISENSYDSMRWVPWSHNYSIWRDLRRVRGLRTVGDTPNRLTGTMLGSLHRILNSEINKTSFADLQPMGNGFGFSLDIGRRAGGAFLTKFGIAQSGQDPNKMSTGSATPRGKALMIPVPVSDGTYYGLQVKQWKGQNVVFMRKPTGDRKHAMPTPARPFITQQEVDNIVNRNVNKMQEFFVQKSLNG